MAYTDRTEHGFFFEWQAEERYWESIIGPLQVIVLPPEEENGGWYVTARNSSKVYGIYPTEDKAVTEKIIFGYAVALILSRSPVLH